MNKKKLLLWGLFFIIFLLITQFFNKEKAEAPRDTGTTGEITIETTKDEYASGTEVVVNIHNNTNKEIRLASNCPRNPFRVLAWTGLGFEERMHETSMNCEEIGKEIVLPAQEKIRVSYTYWNYSLFGEPGRYKIELPLTMESGEKIFSSPEFKIVEAGFWRKLFRTVLYQPLYNILIFFIKIAPGKSLGAAIIVLTILIRLILLVPSQRGIVSQRRMQELQPRLNEIKKKYEGNQERIAQETMKLWKENKVNPFGSCLPILIQFPVLIALFYVIRNGLNPDNTYLIYNPLKDIDLTDIHTNFLGILELTKINTFVLPLIIGALQFMQLKLATALKKKETDSGEKKLEEKKSEMEMANKSMTYIMPVMIAVFTASVPAGVGLYWGVSTLFALGQQIVANKKGGGQ